MTDRKSTSILYRSLSSAASSYPGTLFCISIGAVVPIAIEVGPTSSPSSAVGHACVPDCTDCACAQLCMLAYGRMCACVGTVLVLAKTEEIYAKRERERN